MAPLALLYGRTITSHRGPRLTAFGVGYVVAWGATGSVAFVVADLFGDIAADRPTVARWVAMACFAAAGAYQLTPLKMRCLEHCRSPLGHLMRATSGSGDRSETCEPAPTMACSASAAAGRSWC